MNNRLPWFRARELNSLRLGVVVRDRSEITSFIRTRSDNLDTFNHSKALALGCKSVGRYRPYTGSPTFVEVRPGYWLISFVGPAFIIDHDRVKMRG